MIAEARRRVEEQTTAAGVELAAPEDEGLGLLIVLGGDGTMLRALQATLGTGTPVFGINFGQVGFLTVDGDSLDSALARAPEATFASSTSAPSRRASARALR